MTTVDVARTRSAWQRVASWILVALTAIAVAGSVVGVWVHRTVLDTEQFMAAVTPIVESESVQAVVADRIGDQLVEALDLEARLTERLTEAADRGWLGDVDGLQVSLDAAHRKLAQMRRTATNLGLPAIPPRTIERT
jgi:hypothetical protein